MKLSHEDKMSIMDRFPEIELSYDKILHKKVYADYYLVIPKGKKVLIWFTYYKNEDICLVLELDKDNNISNIYPVVYCFKKELSFNTILHGTITNLNNNMFFTCEDILFYKNKNCQKRQYKEKLEIMLDMFENEIKNTNLFNKNFIITLPIIKNNYIDCFNISQFLSYEVYGILSRRYNLSESDGIVKVNNNNIEAVFKVTADIKQDIYNLHCLNNERKEIFYNIAMIPDYKTSVFMNDLFRTIKENKNLDLLEESDDDEEFENVSEDKFVNLNKNIMMKCVYISKFRKWKPVSLAPKDAKIITKKELFEMQKK
jgi:hypothetical protein